MHNWARSVEFSSSTVAAPTTLPELQRLVAASPRIRALGSGHSFNAIADTDGVHVTLDGMADDVVVDGQARLARVPAGTRYGDLAATLSAQGWALHNLASLPHISVAGTIATGTHGSGSDNPTLSAAVHGLTMVTAGGDVVHLVRDDDPQDFPGMVVSLGALGITTSVDLAIEPLFEVRQYVVEDLSLDAVLADVDAAFGSAYSVSVFTTWSPNGKARAWLKRREDREGPWVGDRFLDGHVADGPRHVLPGLDPVHCTEQGGRLGPWHERLPHFRLDFTPSAGDELQTEYLIPRESTASALRDLAAVAPSIHPLLMICEIRTVAADDLWLSGAYGRPTTAVHFTWRNEPERVLTVLPVLDDVLGSFGGRPHWGKVFHPPAQGLASRYPRFSDFVTLAEAYDPRGKFSNPLLGSWLTPS